LLLSKKVSQYEINHHAEVNSRPSFAARTCISRTRCSANAVHRRSGTVSNAAIVTIPGLQRITGVLRCAREKFGWLRGLAHTPCQGPRIAVWSLAIL
jgi:hypothetical protein